MTTEDHLHLIYILEFLLENIQHITETHRTKNKKYLADRVAELFTKQEVEWSINSHSILEILISKYYSMQF